MRHSSDPKISQVRLCAGKDCGRHAVCFGLTKDLEAGRGVKALDIARRVLEDLQIAGLELYAFHAIPRGVLLDIRLDQASMDCFGLAFVSLKT